MNHHDHFEPPALREITLKVAKFSDGVNLGQGVCLLPVPPEVLDAAIHAISSGKNTYAPPQGVEPLRQALAARLREYNKIPLETNNLLVCAGSTGSLEVISEVLLEPGDEVISFKPFYPYHHMMLKRKQIEIRYVDLKFPTWDFDISQVEAAITPRTKFILVNTPQNPTGKVFSRTELEAIAKLCIKHKVLCVTDEVYEYMTYDGHEHVSMASLPGMLDLTLTMGSYSKTFAITGWRIGYLAAPAALVQKLRTLNDQIYVCAPTPLQHAVGEGIRSLSDDYYTTRLNEYKSKRAQLHAALNKVGFDALLPQGAYYMLAGTASRFPGMTSEQVTDVLIEKAHLGAVPASDFLGREVRGDAKRSNFLRFCYAVPDETIDRAAENLDRL